MFLRGGIEQVKRSLPLILLLNNQYALCSFSVQQATCDNTVSDSSKRAEKLDANMRGDNNGLILYYDQYSFYSQKVVLALQEKKLKFHSHFINIANGEQYEKWFLDINPKGEVPVLQDTGKIIPDSGRIIDYLEDNFSNGDTPRLVPMDQGSEIRQKVTYFRSIIDKINGNVLTIGSFLHPETATGDKKIPFIAPVRTQLVNHDKDNADKLRKYAEQYPEAREMLLEKAAIQEKRREQLLNKDEFLKILDQADEVFEQVEKELSQHTNDQKNWWLCSDRFTVADVCLTILLERVNQVGLEPRFWANGKRPHIEEYYRRVKERDSYKQTIPTTFAFVKTIFIAQAPLIIGVSIAAAIAIFVGGYFVVKKIIYK